MDNHSWLVGIIEGEGCFQIDRSLTPSLTIMVSHRDSELIDACAEVARFGTVKHYPDAPRVPVSRWMVKKHSDLRQLVELLDSHPMRGKKRHEYVLWREAVMLMGTKMNGGHPRVRAERNAAVNARLEELREAIMQLR